MPILETLKDFQRVRRLTFCYLCGVSFIEDDVTDGDHVPPKTAFNSSDREPALKLETHNKCNASFSVEDKKVGQLIALRRREKAPPFRDQALRFVSGGGMAAVTNLNVDAAVWRWIQGFHAALYRQPLLEAHHTLRTPFPRADDVRGRYVLQSLLEQHNLAVATIKRNRAWNNLDRIVSNRGQLRYECVWCLADDGQSWLCVFGLDIYDWKDLGHSTAAIPARGCAGMYLLRDSGAPAGASQNRDSLIATINDDELDPFRA
jgi:hypothetical protein